MMLQSNYTGTAKPEMNSSLCFSTSSTLETSPMHLYFHCMYLVFVLSTFIVIVQCSYMSIVTF